MGNYLPNLKEHSMGSDFGEYLRGCKDLKELYSKIEKYNTEGSYIRMNVYCKDTINFRVDIDNDKFEEDFGHTVLSDIEIYDNPVCDWWASNRVSVYLNEVIEDGVFVKDYYNFMKILDEYEAKCAEISQEVHRFRIKSPITSRITEEVSRLWSISKTTPRCGQENIHESIDILNAQIESIVSNHEDTFSDSLDFKSYEESLLKAKINMEDTHKISIGLDNIITFAEDSSENIDNIRF